MLSIMDFENWLSNEMEKNGWSQSDLARESGLSQAQISRVANGLRPPGNDFCTAVAKALKYPVENVMRAAGLLPSVPESTQQEADLLYLYRSLPANEKADLLRYIRIRLAMSE